MEVLTITDEMIESLRINFDGERFALVHTNKAKAVTKTIILNPKEAQEIARFIIAPEEIEWLGASILSPALPNEKCKLKFTNTK